MKLYEISNKLNEFMEVGFDIDCIDPETGEILEDKVKEKLETLEINFEEKTEGTALFIKNLNAEVEALKKEEANLKTRRISKEKKIESLTNYLSYVLNLSQKDKFETARVKLSFTKSKSVEILDINKLDIKFLRTKTTTEPEKNEIKKAIIAGEVVEGATLKENKNLQIK